MMRGKENIRALVGTQVLKRLESKKSVLKEFYGWNELYGAVVVAFGHECTYPSTIEGKFSLRTMVLSYWSCSERKTHLFSSSIFDIGYWVYKPTPCNVPNAILLFHAARY